MGKKLEALAGNLIDSELAVKVRDSANQLWLAGLGAYAITQAEGEKAFNALVKDGEVVQARTRKVAEGYRDSSIARATGDTTRFSLLQEQYKAAPEVTRKRLWLETVQKVVSENRKVVGDGRQLVYVPMPAAAGTAPAASATPGVLPAEVLMPAVESTPSTTTRSPRPTGREEPQL